MGMQMIYRQKDLLLVGLGVQVGHRAERFEVRALYDNR